MPWLGAFVLPLVRCICTGQHRAGYLGAGCAAAGAVGCQGARRPRPEATASATRRLCSLAPLLFHPSDFSHQQESFCGHPMNTQTCTRPEDTRAALGSSRVFYCLNSISRKLGVSCTPQLLAEETQLTSSCSLRAHCGVANCGRRVWRAHAC